MSTNDVLCAIKAVNDDFKVEYEKILAEMGVRRYKVRSTDTFVAMHSAMAKLGMRIVDQDPALGTLMVDAPAPRPLDLKEWGKARDSDLPRLRELAGKCVGSFAAQMIRFEPEGLEVVIHATLVEVDGESEIALTARMTEMAPPELRAARRIP
jgi:hypothetical protein